MTAFALALSPAARRALGVVAAHGLTDFGSDALVPSYALALVCPIPSSVLTVCFCAASVLHLADEMGLVASLGLHALTQERPTERAWVLEVLGVHPDVQRQGLGGALLEAGLERAREDGAGAYLLTSSEDALPFYQAHGFTVEKHFGLRNGPSMWTLCRKP